MAVESFEMQIRGKPVKVPSVPLGDRRVIVRGNFLRIASVHDENWVAGEVVSDPQAMVAQIRASGLKADLFTFPQRLPDTQPRYSYRMEWDNVAAVRVTSFTDWWERLPQVTRKNVRRAAKRGVEVRVVEFDEALVQGIGEIFDETLFKQGRPFAHRGKDFETNKREMATHLERSEFLGAYLGAELVGFIKLVYLGTAASILQIVSKERHYDKRPMNALVTKAVELCEQKRIPYLLYGKFSYGNKSDSPLAEFKRRNGFEQIDLPRYFVPLTARGSIAARLKLHRGLVGILPPAVIAPLLKVRSGFYEIRARAKRGNAPATEIVEKAEGHAEGQRSD